ncbi:MAG: EamA family transporter [Lachnospiraceae bacterium]
MMYYIILLLGTALGATASMFFKKASASNGLFTLLTNGGLWVGGILYLISALIDIYILRYLDYSVVLPLTSVTYIWTMLLSYFFLKEKISTRKIAGVALIILGAVLVAL